MYVGARVRPQRYASAAKGLARAHRGTPFHGTGGHHAMIFAAAFCLQPPSQSGPLGAAVGRAAAPRPQAAILCATPSSSARDTDRTMPDEKGPSFTHARKARAFSQKHLSTGRDSGVDSGEGSCVAPHLCGHHPRQTRNQTRRRHASPACLRTHYAQCHTQLAWACALAWHA
jgi:hypothetical protein